MANTDKIRSWLRKELEFVPEASTFKLYVVSVDNMKELVDVFKAKNGIPLETMLPELVQAIEQSAKSEAEAMANLVRFRIVSFVRVQAEDGRWKLRRRTTCPFNLAGRQKEAVHGEGGGIGESEPATPTGLLGQLMRHLEATTALNAQLVSDGSEHYRQDNHQLRQEVSSMRKERSEFYAELEAFNEEKHKRTIELKREEGTEVRKKMLTGVLVEQLAPAIMPSIAAALPSMLEKIVGKLPTAAETEAAPEVPTQTVVEPPPDLAENSAKFKNVRAAFLELDEKTQQQILKTVMKSNPASAKKLMDSLL